MARYNPPIADFQHLAWRDAAETLIGSPLAEHIVQLEQFAGRAVVEDPLHQTGGKESVWF